jgi:hypothetical protein
VDLGAIFRLAPGLVDSRASVTGSVDLEVTDGASGSSSTYRVTLSGSHAEIAENVENGSADAVLAGTTSAWIRAMGPMGDREGLSGSGNASLASTLLDILALGEGREASVIEHERDLESATG